MQLIQKYNVQGPRYTSYPTVPFWKNENLKVDEWFQTIEKNIDFFQSKEVSLYIHLPFCESLCTFCGCHKRITKNHGVEKAYIDSILDEWKIYQNKFQFNIVELHLGGGTPTFFSPIELKRLLKVLLQNNQVDNENLEFSFEGHPKNTSLEHLKVLHEFGFRRVSFGVQDYNPEVQKAINRIQSFEQVKTVHNFAKELNYKSISHDLVYGLPKQNLAGFEDSVLKTIELKPDRISLYSYAHVPWMKGNGQRGFDENDLPDNENKRALYERAKELFLEANYIEIGMDHFALKTDDLAKALKNKSLHRNFMGYTTQKTNLLIGLGASSISDSWFGFAQNEKHIEDYQSKIQTKELSIFRGHILSNEDLFLRKAILELMCQFSTKLSSDFIHFDKIKENLIQLELDCLIHIDEETINVTEKGIPFVRNVCMAFDAYLFDNKLDKPMFSKTI
jgi:oxygen-independent coproporphyrinogen III oxidase